MKKKLVAWNNYPKHQSESVRFDKNAEIKGDFVIAYGNGMSYADNSQAGLQLHTSDLDTILRFDEVNGILEAEAGVLLSDILSLIISKGWFFHVTPGTKYITLGGAVASDVHGKNHYRSGCFSEYIIKLELMLPNGKVLTCSRTENSEVFKATCGGMGLTGVILKVEFQLLKIVSSKMILSTIKTKNLKETLKLLSQQPQPEYMVAWIDGTGIEQNLGRAIVQLASHKAQEGLSYEAPKSMRFPFYIPSFLLWTPVFKLLSLSKYLLSSNKNKVEAGIEEFFYPLDKIKHWNRIYGRRGFIQYHFILPMKHAPEGIKQVLETINKHRVFSYLLVLKLHGPENDNYLSFPMEGFSLAMDFKIQKGLEELLQVLDRLVINAGGRLYLAKDSRASKECIKQGYPQCDKFKEVRKKLDREQKFKSYQSERLEL